MANTAVLTLDFGTNGARAAVFDLETRRIVARGEEGYPTAHIPPNRAEQDPNDWWRAARSVVPRVLAEAGDPDVKSISVATFASTVVLCDSNGTVLAPAILWMDARAAIEADRTAKASHPVMVASGGSDAVEWLIPKAMWVASNDPALWARTTVICEALDYINFRLTGQWVGSLMNATCKWNYDSRNRRFCPELYAEFGVPDLATKLPQRIVDIGAVIAPATLEALGELGIRGNPIVVQGGIDAHMGTFGADAVEPGSMLLIGGTSNVHLTQVPDDGADITGVWGPYPNALTPGRRMIEGGQVSAGSILNWLARELFELDDDGFRALAHEAAKIEPDETGLLALDFWMGNRTPYRDAQLRGCILGLSLSHNRAAIFRAAVTAIALGAANVVFDLERQGVRIERIVVAGGIMRNPMWLQATIDAIGKPVEIAEDDNLSLYGCAVAATVGLGIFPDLIAASAALRAATYAQEPNPRAHLIYRRLLDDYRQATELLAPILRKLSSSPAARDDHRGRRAG